MEVHNEFRSVDEVPDPYRAIFAKYPCFNAVQSKVLDELLHTDDSIVVAAPTGSGKTVIFELAIVRFLLKDIGKSGLQPNKVVYLSPIKALCEERLIDWQRKFSKFNISCIAINGDTENFDIKSLIHFHIIIATPEKWDVLTRKWRNNDKLVGLVKLFLIDEIHLLNTDIRGSTLEVTVCRMKSIDKLLNKTEEEKIRFIALSATAPNVDDVAEWIRTSKDSRHFYFAEEMRPVKLNKVVLGYPFNTKTQTAFKFDIYLNYKLQHLMLQYSEGKPVLIFCSTRKSVELTTNFIVRNVKINLNLKQRQALEETAMQIGDAKMKQFIRHGVGFHHAGLAPDSRHKIENCFKCGNLPILVTTSTLAMGVNLPAHLVIIKSTKAYEMGWRDYNETEIFQMIGRAGRPQFDTSATALILTTKADKDKYVNMVGSGVKIESNLHRHFTEHLNAEVVLGTINHLGFAMEWLTLTFLYIRARKNPSHYNLPNGLNADQIDKKLLEMCQIDLNKLVSGGMLTMNENTDIFSTVAGTIMAKYYVAFETMKLFSKMTGNEILLQILETISKCQEFSDVRLRVNDKKMLNLFNRNAHKETIRFPLKGKIKTIDMKINCIIQAVLGNLEISSDHSLANDSFRIMRQCTRVTNCLIEYLQTRTNCYNALLNATILAKCIEAKLWENSEYVSKQLTGIGHVMSHQLAKAGKTTFKQISLTNPRHLELIVKRKPPLGSAMVEEIKHLPEYEMKLEYSRFSKSIILTITLNNVSILEEKSTVDVNSSMILLVGDENNNILVYDKYSHSYMMENPKVIKSLDVEYEYQGGIKADFISDSWVGIDCSSKVVINNPCPPKKPVEEPKEKTTAKKYIQTFLDVVNRTNKDQHKEISKNKEIGNWKLATPKKSPTKKSPPKKSTPKRQTPKNPQNPLKTIVSNNIFGKVIKRKLDDNKTKIKQCLNNSTAKRLLCDSKTIHTESKQDCDEENIKEKQPENTKKHKFTRGLSNCSISENFADFLKAKNPNTDADFLSDFSNVKKYEGYVTRDLKSKENDRSPDNINQRVKDARRELSAQKYKHNQCLEAADQNLQKNHNLTENSVNGHDQFQLECAKKKTSKVSGSFNRAHSLSCEDTYGSFADFLQVQDNTELLEKTTRESPELKFNKIQPNTAQNQKWKTNNQMLDKENVPQIAEKSSANVINFNNPEDRGNEPAQRFLLEQLNSCQGNENSSCVNQLKVPLLQNTHHLHTVQIGSPVLNGNTEGYGSQLNNKASGIMFNFNKPEDREPRIQRFATNHVEKTQRIATTGMGLSKPAPSRKNTRISQNNPLGSLNSNESFGNKKRIKFEELLLESVTKEEEMPNNKENLPDSTSIRSRAFSIADMVPNKKPKFRNDISETSSNNNCSGFQKNITWRSPLIHSPANKFSPKILSRNIAETGSTNDSSDDKANETLESSMNSNGSTINLTLNIKKTPKKTPSYSPWGSAKKISFPLCDSEYENSEKLSDHLVSNKRKKFDETRTDLLNFFDIKLQPQEKSTKDSPFKNRENRPLTAVKYYQEYSQKSPPNESENNGNRPKKERATNSEPERTNTSLNFFSPRRDDRKRQGDNSAFRNNATIVSADRDEPLVYSQKQLPRFEASTMQNSAFQRFPLESQFQDYQIPSTTLHQINPYGCQIPCTPSGNSMANLPVDTNNRIFSRSYKQNLPAVQEFDKYSQGYEQTQVNPVTKNYSYNSKPYPDTLMSPYSNPSVFTPRVALHESQCVQYPVQDNRYIQHHQGWLQRPIYPTQSPMSQWGYCNNYANVQPSSMMYPRNTAFSNTILAGNCGNISSRNPYLTENSYSPDNPYFNQSMGRLTNVESRNSNQISNCERASISMQSPNTQSNADQSTNSANIRNLNVLSQSFYAEDYHKNKKQSVLHDESFDDRLDEMTTNNINRSDVPEARSSHETSFAQNRMGVGSQQDLFDRSQNNYLYMQQEPRQFHTLNRQFGDDLTNYFPQNYPFNHNGRYFNSRDPEY